LFILFAEHERRHTSVLIFSKCMSLYAVISLLRNLSLSESERKKNPTQSRFIFFTLNTHMHVYFHACETAVLCVARQTNILLRRKVDTQRCACRAH